MEKDMEPLLRDYLNKIKTDTSDCALYYEYDYRK